MSVDSNEIDSILAEDYGETDIGIDKLNESINEILDSTPPYLFISLENPYYIAGDRLEGEILIDVPKSLGPATLNFNSQGIEEIHVFNNHLPVSENINKVFGINCKLKSWENLSAGRYLIPFTFKIPHHSPPSFYFSGQDLQKNFIKAQVSYTISAKLVYGDEELPYSRIIVIKSRDSRNNSKVEIEATETVEGICCTSKGTSVFKLFVTSEESPAANGLINYKLIPDNGNCGAPINQVSSEVIVLLNVIDKHKTYEIRYTASNITRITWIAAYTSLVFEKDFEFNADLKIEGEDLNTCSIDSNLIKCKYYIQTNIFYDIKLKRKPACIELDFHVNPMISSTIETPSLPSGWTTTPEPLVKLLIDN